MSDFFTLLDKQICPCGKGHIEKYKCLEDHFNYNNTFMNFRINCSTCSKKYTLCISSELQFPKYEYNNKEPFVPFELIKPKVINTFANNDYYYDNTSGYLYNKHIISYDMYMKDKPIYIEYQTQKQKVNGLILNYINSIQSTDFINKIISLNVPTWIRVNNGKLTKYAIDNELARDIYYDYKNKISKAFLLSKYNSEQLDALSLLNLGVYYWNYPKELWEKMYSIAKEAKSTNALLYDKHFKNFSAMTKKCFYTTNIKNITELLRLLIEIHDLCLIPEDILMEIKKYEQLGELYYKELNNYIAYIQNKSIKLQLSTDIPNGCDNIIKGRKNE